MKIGLFRSLGLIALTVAGVGVLAVVAAPHLLDEGLLKRRVAARIARWTGGHVTIGGPVRLSTFPALSLRISDLRIDGIDRIAGAERLDAYETRIGLALLPALMGRAEIESLVLQNPHLTATRAEAPLSSPAPGSESVRFLRAMTSAPWARVAIHAGRVDFLEGPTRDTVKKLEMNLRLSRADRTVAGSGTFTWRNKPVAFSLDSGQPVETAGTVSAPLRLKVSNPLVQASVSGKVEVTDRLQLAGDLDLRVAGLRAFMRWTGIDMPDGPGLESFTARGPVQWLGRSLSISNGTYTLDGAKAVGALEVNYTRPVPLISGTLALDSIDASTYLSSPAGRPQDKGALAALRLMDADLRVSASRIDAGGLHAESGAMTLRVKGGRLSGQFADLQLCGGHASARLQIDASAATPSLEFAASAQQIAAEECLSDVFSKAPVTGNADVSLDISARGSTLRDAVRTAKGQVQFAAAEGALAFGIDALLDDPGHGPMLGWTAMSGDDTSFQTLRVACLINGGDLKCAPVTLASASRDISGAGRLDLMTQRLDWRLDVSRQAPRASARAVPSDERDVQTVVIRGSLSHPVVVREHSSLGWPEPEPAGPGKRPLGRGYAQLPGFPNTLFGR